MVDMFCRHCGKEMPDDSTFCPDCGGDQEGKTVVVTTPKPPVSGVSGIQPPPVQQYAQPPPPQYYPSPSQHPPTQRPPQEMGTDRGSGPWKILAVVTVTLLFVVAAIIVFVVTDPNVGNGGDDETESVVGILGHLASSKADNEPWPSDRCEVEIKIPITIIGEPMKFVGKLEATYYLNDNEQDTDSKLIDEWIHPDELKTLTLKFDTYHVYKDDTFVVEMFLYDEYNEVIDSYVKTGTWE